jgi:hypothetical protein
MPASAASELEEGSRPDQTRTVTCAANKVDHVAFDDRCTPLDLRVGARLLLKASPAVEGVEMSAASELRTSRRCH